MLCVVMVSVIMLIDTILSVLKIESNILFIKLLGIIMLSILILSTNMPSAGILSVATHRHFS
jgi:hypothetical protein